MLNTSHEASRRRFLQTMAAGILGTGVRVGAGLSAVSAWTGAQTNSVLNHARGADRSPLRIRKVDPCILRLRLRDHEGYYLMCRIQTEEGLVGWGEGTNFPKVATIATEIEMLKPFVIGQSAWDIEKI